MGLRDEIFEQPEVARRLLDGGTSDLAAVTEAIRRSRPAFAVLAARGSSDHAALYAQYLFAIRNELIAALATPSTITLYGGRPRMADALVLGISQSGRSPDIVAVLDEARRQGALTVSMTNDPLSPLASAAEHVVDLRAGPELATAATKTYSAELLAVVMLSAALDETTPQERADIERIPDLMSAALEAESVARRVAAERADADRCMVLGRGYGYATAREWALKLQEMAQVSALAFSSADFEHGPLALAEPRLNVLAVARSGPSLDAQLDLLQRLRREHQVRLLVISDSEQARGIDRGLAIPADVPEWLSPLVEIVPAQLYAYHLTVARGLDPEQPRTITKVTRTT